MEKVILGEINVFNREKKDPVEEDSDEKINANNASLSESDSSDSSSGEKQKHLNEAQEDDLQVQEVEGDWECVECGAHFIGESELHMHYMKHASGEVWYTVCLLLMAFCVTCSLLNNFMFSVTKVKVY